jgi:hypothetical protein
MSDKEWPEWARQALANGWRVASVQRTLDILERKAKAAPTLTDDEIRVARVFAGDDQDLLELRLEQLRQLKKQGGNQ